MIDELTQLGLSTSEAEIFSLLLETGPTFAGQLVYRSKKHRQIVYNALDALLGRKLILVSKKNGKNFYSIGDPRKILVDLKQKETLAQEIVKRVQEKTETDNERVIVFSGPDSYEQGLESFRRNAEEASEYIVMGGEDKSWYLYTRSFFLKHVAELRRIKKKGVDILILFYEKERKSAEEFIGPYVRNPYVCKIAKEELHIPGTIWLAGDNVYILTPVSDPVVVHIKSITLAEQYRTVFWNQWRKATMLH